MLSPASATSTSSALSPASSSSSWAAPTAASGYDSASPNHCLEQQQIVVQEPSGQQVDTLEDPSFCPLASLLFLSSSRLWRPLLSHPALSRAQDSSSWAPTILHRDKAPRPRSFWLLLRWNTSSRPRTTAATFRRPRRPTPWTSVRESTTWVSVRFTAGRPVQVCIQLAFAMYITGIRDPDLRELFNNELGDLAADGGPPRGAKLLLEPQAETTASTARLRRRAVGSSSNNSSFSGNNQLGKPRGAPLASPKQRSFCGRRFGRGTWGGDGLVVLFRDVSNVDFLPSSKLRTFILFEIKCAPLISVLPNAARLFHLSVNLFPKFLPFLVFSFAQALYYSVLHFHPTPCPHLNLVLLTSVRLRVGRLMGPGSALTQRRRTDSKDLLIVSSVFPFNHFEC